MRWEDQRQGFRVSDRPRFARSHLDLKERKVDGLFGFRLSLLTPEFEQLGYARGAIWRAL